MYEKPVFITSNKEEFEKVLNYLKENKIKAKQDIFMGDFVVCVKLKDYFKALTIGSMFAFEEKLETVEWVTPNNIKMKNVDDVCEMSKLSALRGYYLGEKEVALLCDVEVTKAYLASKKEEDNENNGE